MFVCWAVSWADTALDTAQRHREQQSSSDHKPNVLIKCSHKYPTVEELSVFIFYSSMKGLRDYTVGNTVLHEVISR